MRHLYLLILALLTVTNGSVVFYPKGFQEFCHRAIHQRVQRHHHHEVASCNNTCHFHKCPPCRVFSPLYEGGSCICPAETFVPCLLGDPACRSVDPTGIAECFFGLNFTIPSVTGGMTTSSSTGTGGRGGGNRTAAQINLASLEFAEFFDRFFDPSCLAGFAFSATADNDAILMNCTWDVIACKFLPICEDGFAYSPTLQQCVCNVQVDCVKECRKDCGAARAARSPGMPGEPSSSDEEDCLLCDRMVVDPFDCSCIHSCGALNINCIAGTHLDAKTCDCVDNKCNYNFGCFGTEHFDSDSCACVQGSFCSEEIEPCAPFSIYDHNRCCCVPDPCTPIGLVLDPITQVCVAQPCTLTCPNNMIVTDNCTCGCTGIQIVDPLTSTCICPANITCGPGQVVDPSACVCICKPSFGCTETQIMLPNCTCGCNATLAFSCMITGGTLTALCECICPPGEVFDLFAPGCTACVQEVICPPGTYFDNGTICGCLNLPCNTTCDGAVCGFPADHICAALNEFISPCTCNCTHTTCPNLNCNAPNVYIPDLMTCQCTPPCPGLTCPFGGIPNAFNGTCVCVTDCSVITCPVGLTAVELSPPPGSSLGPVCTCLLL